MVNAMNRSLAFFCVGVPICRFLITEQKPPSLVQLYIWFISVNEHTPASHFQADSTNDHKYVRYSFHAYISTML